MRWPHLHQVLGHPHSDLSTLSMSLDAWHHLLGDPRKDKGLHVVLLGAQENFKALHNSYLTGSNSWQLTCSDWLQLNVSKGHTFSGLPSSYILRCAHHLLPSQFSPIEDCKIASYLVILETPELPKVHATSRRKCRWGTPILGTSNLPEMPLIHRFPTTNDSDHDPKA